MHRHLGRLLAAAFGLTFCWLLPASQSQAWGLVGKTQTDTYCISSGNSWCGSSPLAAYLVRAPVLADAYRASCLQGGYSPCTDAEPAQCTASTTPGRWNCTGPRVYGKTADGNFSYNISWSALVVVGPPVLACKPNSTENADGGCICNEGFEADAGECKQINCDVVASSATAVGMLQTTGAGVSICAGGCRLTGAVSAQAADGGYWTWGPYSSSGYCAGDPYTGNEAPPIGTPPPIPCPTGQCPGQINGANVCVPCKTTEVKDAGTKTTTNPDGTKTQTKTETKCEGGKCTTTTTTEELDSSGNPIPGTKTETKDEKPEKSFCQENPKSPLCKESSFGGVCGGGFNCDGDAVTCAIAKEQHKRQCEWAQVDAAVLTEGGTATGAGLRPADHPFANPLSVNFSLASAIDQSDPIASGCPVDEVIAGIRLPFSALCTPLTVMGHIAVAFAFVAAFRIVFGS